MSVSEVSSSSERTIGSLIGRLAASLEHLSTGDLAELRRASPNDPGSPAFWKVAIRHGLLGERDGVEAERRWIVILGVLAQLHGQHRPGVRLGAALAQAGLSELRLVRLLRARGDQLYDESRSVAQILASKGVSADLSDLARLILTPGEDVRRRIARSYFSAVASK